MTTEWDRFFREKCIDLFTSSERVLDIGEGLRIRKDTGNKYDPKRAWLQEYINRVEYVVMDPVADYGPDIVGDIHEIPLEDNSQDAVICIAQLFDNHFPKKNCRQVSGYYLYLVK